MRLKNPTKPQYASELPVGTRFKTEREIEGLIVRGNYADSKRAVLFCDHGPALYVGHLFDLPVSVVEYGTADTLPIGTYFLDRDGDVNQVVRGGIVCYPRECKAFIRATPTSRVKVSRVVRPDELEVN